MPADFASGVVLWFTGLSGSGKTTLALATQRRLADRGDRAALLDGDVLRRGLSADLGYSENDRAENVRRAAAVAALIADAGLVAICGLISPYADARRAARETVGGNRFIEIHLDVGVDVCERRDPKGLYAKARRGEIVGFTGVDAPYEAPVSPDLALDTDRLDVTSCVDAIVAELTRRM